MFKKRNYNWILLFERLIVGGCWDGKVKIWCRESAECLATITIKVYKKVIPILEHLSFNFNV